METEDDDEVRVTWDIVLITPDDSSQEWQLDVSDESEVMDSLALEAVVPDTIVLYRRRELREIVDMTVALEGRATLERAIPTEPAGVDQLLTVDAALMNDEWAELSILGHRPTTEELAELVRREFSADLFPLTVPVSVWRVGETKCLRSAYQPISLEEARAALEGAAADEADETVAA